MPISETPRILGVAHFNEEYHFTTNILSDHAESVGIAENELRERILIGGDWLLKAAVNQHFIPTD